MPRRFSSNQRVAMFLHSQGRCENCNEQLQPSWHADHNHPWSKGGITDTTNGQALCPTCNLTKGATMATQTQQQPPLRHWQQHALNTYANHDNTDFLLVACPGAGKTRWALTVAHQHLDRADITQLIVAVPTESLKYQWAQAADQLDIDLKPDWANADGAIPHDYDGVVVTYAQLAACPDLLRMHTAKQPTLVVLDEIHHCASTATWGDAVKHAFDPAVSRIAASGTPFRSDGEYIPYVAYDTDGMSRAHFTYGYGQAVAEGVCRPLYFPQYDGQFEWHDGDQLTTATFDDDLDLRGQSRRLRTALTVNTDFMHTLLDDAHQQLTQLREGDGDTPADPTAAGLVLAIDQHHARQLADQLAEITRRRPVVATSDDPDARELIDAFDGTADQWLVAVRMVSEGTDIPPLRVLVYATNYVSPLFFRQAAGRVVRINHDSPVDSSEQDAFMYLPNDPRLAAHARRIHDEANVPGRIDDDTYDQRDTDAEAAPSLFMAVAAEGQLAWVTHDGDPVSSAELDLARRLGSEVGFNDVRDVTRLARVLRLAGVQPSQPTQQATVVEDGAPKFKRMQVLRKHNSKVASRIAYTAGLEHAEVNQQLNQLADLDSVKEATEEQLQQRLSAAERWLTQVYDASA